MSFVLLFTVVAGLFIALAVGAFVMRRWAAGVTHPRCGRCRYNLTGATSNRCPECGALFIEAGVLVPEAGRSRTHSGTVITIALCLGILLISGGLSVLFAVRANQAQAQARAMQARAQATTAQQAARAATASAPTSQDEAP